jgi:hypothetical protein
MDAVWIVLLPSHAEQPLPRDQPSSHTCPHIGSSEFNNRSHESENLRHNTAEFTENLANEHGLLDHVTRVHMYTEKINAGLKCEQ